jgi:hypothetical protein
MSKKITISLILAVCMAMGISLFVIYPAFAQPSRPPHPHPERLRGIGQVKSIDEDTFTVILINGDEHVLKVDENTHLRTNDGEEATFDNLEVNRWVAAGVHPGPDGVPIATVVVILPEDFDPASVPAIHAEGVLSNVDHESETLTLRTRLGKELTFTVNQDTLYRGDAKSFQELASGMRTKVFIDEANGDIHTASLIQTNYPERKLGGQISEIDLGASTFTVHTIKGADVEINVDENTRFRGKVSGLDTLETGMGVLVNAELRGEDNLVALSVGATERSFPMVGKRLAGKVVSIDGNAFSLEKRNGDQVTVTVNADTQFQSPGDWLKGIEDLKVGMPIAVGAEELDDGGLLAVVVRLAMRPVKR